MAAAREERIPTLRGYRESLSAVDKKIYDEKLKIIAGIDPYSVSSSFFSKSVENWPEIEFPDIVNYMLFSSSRFTKEQLKAYKSLQSYQYFVAGWVRGVFVGKATSDISILIGKVNHSQRLSEAPLKPWLAVKANGTVLTAHCNCMAGLGEVCSHVGAILFAVEAGVRMQKARTCTSIPCQWIMPTPVSNVPYDELRNIDFTASSTKKRKLYENLQVSQLQQQPPPPPTAKPSSVYHPSPAEISRFYNKISGSGTKPAILSLVAPYNQKYIPKNPTTDFPKTLSGLYSEELRALSCDELLSKANEMFKNISCSKEQASNLEQATRQQRNSEIWLKMRTGRITASKFHQASHTDPAKPSVSLIKEICYGANFHCAATDWGCRQEKKVLNQFRKVMEGIHQNFTLKPTGLWISPDNPHIGATPDAISSCDCHESCCVEVKCPYSIKDQHISEAVINGSTGLCLEHSSNGLQLKRSHPYWTQVQVQLQVTGLTSAHFIVWTPKDMHIETIEKDPKFFHRQLEKVTVLFKSAILPELLAKWYSIPKKSSSPSKQASQLFCYCREEDEAALVLLCSGSSCVFRKFHLKCCGLSRMPSTKKPWFCTDCRRLHTVSSTNNVRQS